VKISPSASVELTKPTLAGPNPFSPLKGTSKIVYTLGSVPGPGIDVDVCIYDLTGSMIWKITNPSTPGDNSVTWDGRTQFGELIGNGVYPYLLVVNSDGSKKVLGRSKIAVLK
jgi:flagellar hook assembly protein FlgD